MATNKAARDSVALVALFVALGVLVVANLLADRGFLRLDLTGEGRYSLSEPFQRIIGKLEEPLSITYYVSGTVPAGFDRNKRDILDKLGEIKTAGKGRIELEVIDPTLDENLQKKLVEEDQNVEIQAQSMDKDKVSFAVLYSAIRLTYEAKPSVLISRIMYPEELEYQLANSILAMAQKERPIVALQAPKQDMPMMNPMMRQQPPPTGFEWLSNEEFFGKKFDIRQVDLTESSNIPKATKLLILIKPEKLSERARYEVTKYLSEGGRVFLVAAPKKVNMMFRSIEDSPSGLEEYLKDIGLSWADRFTCDKNNVQLVEFNFFNPNASKVYAHPMYVKILAANVDQESPITRYLPNLVMPFPVELKLDDERLSKAGLKSSVLAKTSKECWSDPLTGMFDPRKKVVMPETFEAQKPTFVQLEGEFPFPYEGKPIPEWAKKEDEAKPDEKKEDKKEEKKGESAHATKAPGMLLVWSSPDSFNYMFLSNEQVGREFRGNITVLPNVVEVCALSDDLVRIRAKSYETRTIQKFEEKDWKRNAVKVSLIAGVPLVLLLFAFVRWILRRGAQIRYERAFAQTTGPSSFSP